MLDQGREGPQLHFARAEAGATGSRPLTYLRIPDPGTQIP